MAAPKNPSPTTAATAPAPQAAAPAAPTTPSASGAPAEPPLPGNGVSGTATATGTATEKKTVQQTVAEALADVNIINFVKGYDEATAKVQSYMVDIAEYVGKNNTSRPVLIKSIMEARGCTRESAEPQASRIAKLAKDPDLIAKIRRGETSIRTALFTPPKSTKTDGAATGGGEAGGAAGAGQPQSKQEAYNRWLENGKAVCKGTGLDADSLVTSFRAMLKEADIK